MQKYSGIIGAIVLIILALGAFYWFQVRPAQIKKDCTARVYYKCNITKNPDQCKGLDATARMYDLCLHESGL